ncbi:hypothetical protein [Flammeovirga agarivorans]|uniref:Uncharacterized protein n=1 Tax=Flammeovirga agarivorans TaxID=2726742 RepID=A0A7X8XVX5_9BACT|nr:hypothetical protein [Flammeovirga agarivorans]NLR91684.1 hypothetical protein [Flammeovirga agarivorans]
MKSLKLLHFLFLSFLFFFDSNSTILAQKLPNGLDGVLNYNNGNFVDFSKYKGFIIRSNNVSLKLDELIYYVEDKGEFYISLEVNYYDWKDKNINRPEPIYSFAQVFKENIVNNKTTHSLKNIRLTSNLPLDKVNNVEIIATIVKKNNKQEKINGLIDQQLNSSLSSFPAISIINQLIAAQREDDDKPVLLFKSDYDIPLNSFEFANKEITIDSTRLILNNDPIYIPLNADVKSQKLKPSVLAGAFKLISDLSGVITGATFSDKNIQFKGMMKLHFTTDDNSNVPNQISEGLDDVVFSINRSDKWKSEFNSAKENLWAILKTYKRGEDSNDRITYGVKSFIDLSVSYTDLLNNREKLTSNIKEFHDFYNEFRDFYDDLSYHETDYGFVSYGVESIYNNSYARIFIPYGLDDRTAKTFIKWQIAIHEFLNSVNYDDTKKGISYKLNFATIEKPQLSSKPKIH